MQNDSTEKNIEYWNRLAVRAITDEFAFTELYKYFFPRVYKFLMLKTNNAEVSDEIISRTFMKMYEHLSSYDEKKAAFSTWLYHIAENELRMFWRTQKSHGEKEEDWDENFDAADDEFKEPEHQALEKERQEKIRAALEKLNERERKIIELTYWLNYTPRKIAELLDMTPNHVSVVLKRAKSNLKKYLNEED